MAPRLVDLAGQAIAGEIVVHGFREQPVGRNAAATALLHFLAVVEHVKRSPQAGSDVAIVDDAHGLVGRSRRIGIGIVGDEKDAAVARGLGWRIAARVLARKRFHRFSGLSRLPAPSERMHSPQESLRWPGSK